MALTELSEIRDLIRVNTLAGGEDQIARLIAGAALDEDARARISGHAIELIEAVRNAGPEIMENFLAEYSLSTSEGIALMCLAEALLRVPDTETIDALIEDKIAPSDWSRHLGNSASPLVNASSWALMLTGRVLTQDDEPGIVSLLHDLFKRMGEPAIRAAAAQAIKEVGRQFVLGTDITQAMERAAVLERQGYRYSYDMLGEAACTDADATRYYLAYSGAIKSVAAAHKHSNFRDNPGISVKLSALHPRFEPSQRDRVLAEIFDPLLLLAVAARSAAMGFTIDAEEASKLDLSLDVIEAVLSSPVLAGWDGFGVAVQAYGPRAPHVIDWLYALSLKLDRRITVRLVKGAYWDTEIKRAQILGLSGFPVFTRKSATDISYIACARKLLAMTDRIYPQFATHNAHTAAAILEMAEDRRDFEFQRLHGMGQKLHETLLEDEGARCRIYAPVGAHRDLLAYLIRRLLENGANSSFVHQIINEEVSPEIIAADPFHKITLHPAEGTRTAIVNPRDLFQPERPNSLGLDLDNPIDLARIDTARTPFRHHVWQAGAIIDATPEDGPLREIRNPARQSEIVGYVADATPGDVHSAIKAAESGFSDWSALPARSRAQVLRDVSDLFEARSGEFFALLAREAGKTVPDCIGELREAVDFLRYYAAQAEQYPKGEARGILACISPWNFPLAIFTGQIAAALGAGNAVIAKPAEQTPLIAARAVKLFHQAGVPPAMLQMLPGPGETIGNALSSDPRIAGLCFTGSLPTAQLINRSMAAQGRPDAPLIAETGGLNAMVVDSTALCEQAVRDILSSAFQSAGQRCSALRILYVQRDIADEVLAMLSGAMKELCVGDPWELSTDLGPVIDGDAKKKIDRYVRQAETDGRLLCRCNVPDDSFFTAPVILRTGGIEELEEEIFGPVLHVATFDANEIDHVIDAINASRYGLTFGLHTRIDDRVQKFIRRLKVGNIYVNRNQIGAVVGSQPFGGEGLSGTGPKAGGPAYLPRLLRTPSPQHATPSGPEISLDTVQQAVATLECSGGTAAMEMPGSTGESNRLTLHPRGIILCLGPMADAAYRQAMMALDAGCAAIMIAPGAIRERDKINVGNERLQAIDGILSPDLLVLIDGIDAVAFWASPENLRPYRESLSARDGPILPLIVEENAAYGFTIERHICIDTTAAGGNASLLAGADQDIP